jgi:hypothetical protein
VIADVVLNRRIDAEVLANLGVNLVPGPADPAEQETAERAQVFAQPFRAAAPDAFDPFAARTGIEPALQSAARAFGVL